MTTNLITFPDWMQPEDFLYQDLVNLIKKVANFENTNLLVDITGITEDEAELMFSTVITSLTLEEGLEISDSLELKFVGNLSYKEWYQIQSQIQGVVKVGLDYPDYRQKINDDPLNAELHYKFAKFCLENNNYYLAYAEFCNAKFLGKSDIELEKILSFINQKIPPLTYLDHNQYYRLFSLAEEIKNLQGEENWSILDVGGGDGKLALFIPNSPYCLAEPSVNGISGTNLPFADKMFDVVVSCHVLEHIPIPERELFLDNLISKAKKAVILLNPFEVEGTFVKERLELMIEITNAEWAKEHLECSLPTLDDIKLYAEKRGLNYKIKPNGIITTSIAMVFLSHFANKSGCYQELGKINQFYNDDFLSQEDKRKEGLYPIFQKVNSASTLAFKTCRYQYLLDQFLRKIPEVYLLGIIRNPCAVINSWFKNPKEFPVGSDQRKEWRIGGCKNQGREEEFFGFFCI